MLAVMLVLAGVVVMASVLGGAKAQYVPYFEISDLSNPWTLYGGIGYFVFLLIPTVLNIAEGIKWRILRSKI